MNRSSRRWPGPACLPLTLLAALVGPSFLPSAHAQPDRVTAFRQGTHAFRRTLYDALGGEVTALTRPEELQQDPGHTLLIVLGETEVLERIPGGLQRFVEQGGAALVATDRAVPSARLSPAFGISFDGQPVFAGEPGLDRTYHDLIDCPFVEPTSLKGPPLFQGLGKVALKRVATNRPSYLHLERTSGGLRRLAVFPAGSWARGQGFALKVPHLCFAVGGDWGDSGGRILLLSDHSVFINDMMTPVDNDNLEFASNCLEWLTDGGKRSRVLFVEEDEVQTAFDIPVRDVGPPIPPLGVIVEAINQALRGLDEENTFNRMIDSRLEQMPWDQRRRLVEAVVVLLTVLLSLYGLVRLGFARHRQEVGAPLLDAVLRRQPVPAAVMVGRRQELLRSGNFWEPARALTRQWFEAVLGPRLSVIDRRSEQQHRPVMRVKVKGGLWHRWTVGRYVRELWRFAHEDRPRRVSLRQLRRLTVRLEGLKAAVARDEVRFEVPEG
jgi:hypothetical protein